MAKLQVDSKVNQRYLTTLQKLWNFWGSCVVWGEKCADSRHDDVLSFDVLSFDVPSLTCSLLTCSLLTCSLLTCYLLTCSLLTCSLLRQLRGVRREVCWQQTWRRVTSDFTRQQTVTSCFLTTINARTSFTSNSKFENVVCYNPFVILHIRKSMSESFIGAQITSPLQQKKTV